METINRNELLKLANASMLSISEHESDIPRLIQRLDAVLRYVSGIQKLAKGNQEHALPHNINIVRQDKVISFDWKKLLDLAPREEGNYFVVPKIIK